MTTDTKPIAEIAYALWRTRGSPYGSPEEDWFEAQRLAAPSAGQQPPAADEAPGEGAIDEALSESFPASDPPATHTADVPPSNTDAKWTAALSSEPIEPPETH